MHSDDTCSLAWAKFSLDTNSSRQKRETDRQMDMCTVDREGLGLMRPKSLLGHEAVMGGTSKPH